MKQIKNILTSLLVFALLMIAMVLVIGEPDDSVSFFGTLLIKSFGFLVGGFAIHLMGNWNMYDKNETV